MPSPSWWAGAFEIVDKFGTDTAVDARRRRALVNLCLAVLSSESSAALAFVLVHLVEATVSSNRIARIVQTLINIDLTLSAQVTGSAEALEALGTVGASTAVLARSSRSSRSSQSRSSADSAVVDSVLTVLSGPSGSALTFVIGFQVVARPSIEARLCGALVYLDTAISSSPTRFANALSLEEAIDASAMRSAR